jgi:hypothetical protein
MMTDSLIAGAAGGIASKATEKLIDYAARLLQERIGVGPPEALGRAERNVETLLNLLQRHVTALALEVRDQSAWQDHILDNLTSPDFWFTVHSGIMAGARCATDQQREVLATILAQRLQAPAESEAAAVSAMAIEAAQYLTAQHLRVLATVVMVLDGDVILPSNRSLQLVRHVLEVHQLENLALFSVRADVAHLKLVRCLAGLDPAISEDTLMKAMFTPDLLSVDVVEQYFRQHEDVLTMLLTRVRGQTVRHGAGGNDDQELRAFLASEVVEGAGKAALALRQIAFMTRLAPVTPAGRMIGLAYHQAAGGLGHAE